MRTLRLAWALAASTVLALATVGCGGAGGVDGKTPDSIASKTSASKPKTPGRMAIEILDEPGQIGAAIDARRFRSSPLYTVALVALDGTPYEKLEERFDKECRFNLFDALGVIAYRANNEVGALAVDINRSREEIYACANKLVGPLSQEKIAGQPALGVSAEDNVYILVDRGVLLIGDRDLLAKFHHDPPANIAVRGKYALGEGEVARVDLADHKRVPAPLRAITARIISTTEELTAKARVRVAEGKVQEVASDVTTFVAAIKSKLVKSGSTEGISIVDTIAIEHEGDDVLMTVGTRGNVVEQAKYLGNFAALAMYEMQRYLRNAKAAEARSEAMSIANRIVSAAERSADKRKVLTCPASAPPVPKDTPKGTAHQTASADWQHASWRAIEYSRDVPQFYSYEIVTAKDKRSCKVIAHGDLDGNGKESRFEVEVKFGKGGPNVSKLVEADPEE